MITVHGWDVAILLFMWSVVGLIWYTRWVRRKESFPRTIMGWLFMLLICFASGPLVWIVTILFLAELVGGDKDVL